MNVLIEKIKYEFNEKKKLKDMMCIIENYELDDWIKYIKFDDNKYNRIKIYADENFEIILICWKKDQKSRIHDHPENGCIMKLLSGKLIESKYINDKSLSKILTRNIYCHDTTYIKGNFGLHDIFACENSVSLHIYSPSFYVPTYFN